MLCKVDNTSHFPVFLCRYALNNFAVGNPLDCLAVFARNGYRLRCLVNLYFRHNGICSLAGEILAKLVFGISCNRKEMSVFHSGAQVCKRIIGQDEIHKCGVNLTYPVSIAVAEAPDISALGNERFKQTVPENSVASVGSVIHIEHLDAHTRPVSAKQIGKIRNVFGHPCTFGVFISTEPVGGVIDMRNAAAFLDKTQRNFKIVFLAVFTLVNVGEITVDVVFHQCKHIGFNRIGNALKSPLFCAQTCGGFVGAVKHCVIHFGCGVVSLAVPEKLEIEKRNSRGLLIPFLADDSVLRKGENIKIVIVKSLNHFGHRVVCIAVG